MPLRAAAFHKSVSVQKLEELFRNDEHILFAGTASIRCSHCQTQFAVFLPDKDSPDKNADIAQIQQRIDVDCRQGQHVAEILIQRQ